MNLKEFLKTQKNNIEEELRLDCEFLILETLGLTKLDAYSSNVILSADNQKKLLCGLEKLKSGEPLAYILKSQNFLNNSFFVDPRVLIPRPETECMVDYLLKSTKSSCLKVLDAGAGSGCIGISFLLERKNAHCIFIEKSVDAIEVLKINLNKFNIDERRYAIYSSFEELKTSKILAAESLDLFVSNPPYISISDDRVGSSVLKHEPHLALYAQDNGLFFLKEWSLIALTLLRPDAGIAVFEFGQGQENFLQSYANVYKMNSEILLDQYSVPRFWKITK